MKISKMVLPALLAAGALQAQDKVTQGNVVVHEWGTFTSVQGSDGQVLDGLQHEEEALPSFVHGRDPLHETSLSQAPPVPDSRPTCRSFKCAEFMSGPGTSFTVTQKMETPVVYFYSDTPEAGQRLKLDIGFPKGVISQYYPAPQSFAPGIGQATDLSGGKVSFDVTLSSTPLSVPFVSSRSVYSPSRSVPASFLQSAGPNGQENERFIFYRGLGNFATALKVTSSGGALQVRNQGADRIPAAFLLQVDTAGGAIQPLGAIASGTNLNVSSSVVDHLQSEELPKARFFSEGMKELEAALVDSGLYASEAHAMAETWKLSYFATPGLRVLYILPRSETETVLPMQVSPAPRELVRTLVGRIEVLRDTEEKQLLSIVEAGHLDSLKTLLGRFTEPKLRRLSELEGNAYLRFAIDSAIMELN